MNSPEIPLWEAIDAIRETDDRYHRQAYAFVVAALGVTVQGLPAERLNEPERRHLSGSELLEGIGSLARREFGALAATVFREWGVLSNEDVGNIVFQLVETGQLSARPQDSIDDFRHAPEILDVLEGRAVGRPPPEHNPSGPST
jgi:uncharacterized repeat protein (TIGR04138 family)